MSDIFQTDEYIVKDNPYLDQGSGGGGEGHTYNLVPNSSKDEVNLTEDGVNKTTLPLISEFIGTRAAWNALSATEKARYRKMCFTDDGGYGNSYDIPHGQSNVGADLDDTKNSEVTFTSSDTTDGNAASWTSVATLASGEKHSSILAKISQMFKNVRYLFKELTTVKSSLAMTIIRKGSKTVSCSANNVTEETVTFSNPLTNTELAAVTGVSLTPYYTNQLVLGYRSMTNNGFIIQVRNVSPADVSSIPVRYMVY